MGSLPKNKFVPLDQENFTNESHKVIEFIADYYKNIEKFPVRSQVDPGYLLNQSPCSAPSFPESLETILDDMKDLVIPGLTHWQSPNFFAYFQLNVSTAAFLGEMLCTSFNVAGFNWINSPAATELEMIVINWMGKMLKLPQEFLFSSDNVGDNGGSRGGGGVIHGSTCEAVVCVLAAARDNALKKFGAEKITKLVVYASDQTHSMFQKGAKLVGIPPNNLRIIPTFSSSNFALSPNDLRTQIEKDLNFGFVPLVLCATIGTTTCGAVDPLEGLGLVAREFGVWMHVDAAYAGSACICPEFRHYLDGVEYADSVSMNPHKWFLTSMDCCCLWLKKPEILTESLSIDPEYLKNKLSDSKNVVDYKDWQISLSRRFRALKLWIVMRKYGVKNLMSHIRSDIDMAKHFESLVVEDPRFEVVVPRKFALVCLRIRPKVGEEKIIADLNRDLLEAVNASGRAYISHGEVNGMFIIRCAIGGTLTEMCHVEALWKLIQEKVDLVLAKRGAT